MRGVVPGHEIGDAGIDPEDAERSVVDQEPGDGFEPEPEQARGNAADHTTVGNDEHPTRVVQHRGSQVRRSPIRNVGERFASRMHIDDLKAVLQRLGFDYTLPGAAGNWQELCPPCKRKSIAAAQLRLKEEFRG